MDKPSQDGTWLLLDAAGPESVVGLVRGGEWLALERNEGDFLEWHERAIRQLLHDNALTLADLAGTLYACGPGSSLGIRLAAMFIRTLMRLPALAHWRCRQYQNLELALAGRIRDQWEEAVAPWRRDCLHHTRLVSRAPLRLASGTFHPDDEAPQPARGILLGRRPANRIQAIAWHSYPVLEIPLILAAYPELLTEVERPSPYVAEEPQFARWSSRRHGAE